ncbi:MAG: hypothetical protein NTY34_01380 [Candidatus Omnitrophica bacterium]|nr:hypothetical protein [Candidatus Omnitrophota bacterium]
MKKKINFWAVILILLISSPAFQLPGPAFGLGKNESLEKNSAVEKNNLLVEIDLTWKESGSLTGVSGVNIFKDFLYRATATVETRIYKVPRYFGDKPGFVIAQENFTFRPIAVTASYRDTMAGVYSEVVPGNPAEGSIEGGGNMEFLNINISPGAYQVIVKNPAYSTEQGFRPGGPQGEIETPIVASQIPYAELKRTGVFTRAIHQQKVSDGH